MIDLKVEAAIDLDQNRRIWMTGTATVTAEALETHDLSDITDALAGSVIAQTVAAYDKVVPQVKMGRPEGAPHDPVREPMRTFED